MIYYLGAQRHAELMHAFLADWGRELAGRITTVSYGQIFSGAPVRLFEGAYIFTSLGSDLGSRNPPSPARQEISRLRNLLAERFGPARVLNDPLSSLRRYDLLSLLHEKGVNRFAAYRADRASTPERFPVFLRPEHGTIWDPPEILRSAEEYRAVVARAGNLSEVLAVEVCDTADDAGVYRKYACFIVGDRIVPRHLFFSRRWWVKEAVLCEPAMLEEELAFLDSNPHEAALREVSRIANIQYGRIDYSVRDGQPQIWEINLNPLIFGNPAHEIAARRQAHLKFLHMYSAALDAVDPPAA